MSDTNGKNVMDFNQFERNAIVGETVYFYPSGTRQEVPTIAWVVASFDRVVELRVPGGAKMRIHKTVRHIDDPYFDGRGAQRAKYGAWDFHEVWGPIADRQLKNNTRNLERLAKLKEMQSDMPPAEFEALVALENHGPVMDRIVKDTGMTVSQLNDLPTFMEKFKQAKLEKWEEKQARSAASNKGFEKKRAEKEAAKEATKSEKTELATASV